MQRLRRDVAEAKVNAEGMLTGIVTVDDALYVLLPTERRRKPMRMY